MDYRKDSRITQIQNNTGGTQWRDSTPVERLRASLEQFSPTHEAIVARLCSCGYEAYITGGAVRDLLLGRDPLDFDVVTNAKPDEIAMIFKGENVKEVGQAFNVTLVNGIEVATYRQDTYYGGGHRDCSVQLVEELRKDLERRDLTFNSMAFCPYTGDLIDPFGGRNDLEKGLVRFVGDPYKRIQEDPDRIVRACRFASNLNGSFDAETLQALQENIWQLDKVAPERLRLEVQKALRVRHASRFFKNLEHIGALARLFPALKACIGHDGGRYHQEDVFEHCMLVGDAISPRCWMTKLAGYLHDVGKPEAAALDAHGSIKNFIGHESAGVRVLKRDLRDMKFSNFEIDFITSLVKVHMHSLEPDSTPRAVRKLLARLAQNDVEYRTFLRFRLADRKGNKAKPARNLGEIRGFLEIMEKEVFSLNGQQEFTRSMLAINGYDLISEFGLKPGPLVGNILQRLFEEVLRDPSLNERKKLLSIAGEVMDRNNIVSSDPQSLE